MAYPSTVAAIEAALVNLAARFPTLCARDVMPQQTVENRPLSFLRIGKTGPPPRPAILFTAGIHAREYAPPDILISFCEKLLVAYSTNAEFVFPEFSNARYKNASGGQILWSRAKIAPPDVQRIVDRCDLYVAPLINPDGRVYAMTTDDMWRKNRRPLAAPNVGVDLNRNFPFAWDFNTFYTPAAALDNHASTDPSDDSYIGDPTGPNEVETQNLMWMFQNKHIAYYVDIHACGHMVLWPWGDDDTGTDPSQNFGDPGWDHRRDGLKGAAYKEYIPVPLNASVERFGNRIRDAMVDAAGADTDARASSTYLAGPVARTIYTATGSAPDYCFSRQFKAIGATILVYTIECGSPAEGNFHPNPLTEYPKIEREVHAGLLGLLTAVPTTTPTPPPPAAPLPGATVPPTTRSSRCFVATAAYGSAAHPAVAELRRFRDRSLKRSRPGSAAIALYEWLSPPLAAVIADRPHLRSLARICVLAPLVATLRALRRFRSVTRRG